LCYNIIRERNKKRGDDFTETEQEHTKLDYTIKSAADRITFVEQLIPKLTKTQLKSESYMEILSNYIISAMTPEEKKKKTILTDNRMVTINKRETSMQRMIDSFENGEDGLWHLAIEDDKNVLLTHKKEITKKDLEEIKPLRDLKVAIELLKEQEKNAKGKKKYNIKKTLIEMCQEQYIIKDAYKPIINSLGTPVKNLTRVELDEKIIIDTEGEPRSNCVITLFNPSHICALLCNYSALKEDCYDKLTWDFWYLMQDLDNLIEKTLKDNYPLYYKLLIYKIDGKSNADIQLLLEQEFNLTYTVEYLSSLWRNKIPKLLAEKAKEDYIVWYYTHKEYGKWKRCSRCGEVKLAHNRFFSKNNTSKDGWYSICKECRNKKNKEGVE